MLKKWASSNSVATPDFLSDDVPNKSAEVELTWNSSVIPGGSFYLEHNNVNGKGQSLTASVSTSNILYPEEDLGFKATWIVPFSRKVKDFFGRTFNLTALKLRGLSPALNPGPESMENFGSVWVDRLGFKALISEEMAPKNIFSYGLIFEEVTTRDESGLPLAHLNRTTSDGAEKRGPATCHSPTGRDFLTFLQLSIIRDNTEIIGGSTVGSREIFQVDQSLGVLNSSLAFFNRSRLKISKFLPLKLSKKPLKKAPIVLILNGEGGMTLGDVAPYDWFPLGGPHSVRGFGFGELGSSPQFLQISTELQVPFFSSHLTFFAEHGNDLGNCRNPEKHVTSFFQKEGSGSSFGVGIKTPFGVRVELVRDTNSQSFHMFADYGDRH